MSGGRARGAAREASERAAPRDAPGRRRRRCLLLGLVLVVLLGTAILVCTALAGRTRLPAPALLLGSGVLMGFVPALHEVQLPPELMLLIFLPLLLYWESLSTSLREIRKNLTGIAVMSTLLVIATAAAVAVLAHLWGLPWGAAWVLGAAVAPTDATAVSTVAGGSSAPGCGTVAPIAARKHRASFQSDQPEPRIQVLPHLPTRRIRTALGLGRHALVQHGATHPNTSAVNSVRRGGRSAATYFTHPARTRTNCSCTTSRFQERVARVIDPQPPFTGAGHREPEAVALRCPGRFPGTAGVIDLRAQVAGAVPVRLEVGVSGTYSTRAHDPRRSNR
ncbi:cation:proton antiporter [Nocardiopsis sp. ARC36]